MASSLVQNLVINNVSSRDLTVGMRTLKPGRSITVTDQDEIEQHTKNGPNGALSTVEKYRTAGLISYSRAQSGTAILSATATTLGAVAESLLSFQIPNNSVVVIEGTVTARKTDNLVGSTWRYRASFANNGGAVRQLGADDITPTQQDAGAAALVLASGAAAGTIVPLEIKGIVVSDFVWSFNGVMYVG